MNKLISFLSIFTFGLQTLCLAQNQTTDLSEVFPEDPLPFTLEVDIAPFTLPNGLQSFASAQYKGRWIFLAGRTNGLHGFDNIGTDFPPQSQNTVVHVIDPLTGASQSRDLKENSSGLSQKEIDHLSVTSAQFFQKGKMLYLVGGYGVDTETDTFGTKSSLIAIDLEKLLLWVATGQPSVKSSIKQVFHPLLQVTGGFLFQDNSHSPFLLILGQNFIGRYSPNSNGIYTKQIRPFWLNHHGKSLALLPHESNITFPDYRRRDLNVVPILHHQLPWYVAFAGVFTLETGVWTVPIWISPSGESFEPDPQAVATFKQAMNHYACPSFGLYSAKSDNMYVVLPGGISFGYFQNGTFQTDSEIPFINQITIVQIDKQGQFTQYLMNAEYPYIPAGPNNSNPLLFGAEAAFFPASNVPLFHNGVIQLDTLPISPVILGYIAGGIMSKLPNTTSRADSTASPFVFTVRWVPKP